MTDSGAKRLVSLTGHGANAPGDHSGPIHIISRLILKLLAPKILRDGEQQISTLAASDLAWTVIRSPIMRTYKNPRAYKLSHKRPGALAIIDRRAVVKALLDLAANTEFSQQAPFITNG